MLNNTNSLSQFLLDLLGNLLFQPLQVCLFGNIESRLILFCISVAVYMNGHPNLIPPNIGFDIDLIFDEIYGNVTFSFGWKYKNFRILGLIHTQ
ncbi:hypothetical protein D3C74_461720 [compost metagenome]